MEEIKVDKVQSQILNMHPSTQHLIKNDRPSLRHLSQSSQIPIFPDPPSPKNYRNSFKFGMIGTGTGTAADNMNMNNMQQRISYGFATGDNGTRSII